MYLIIHFLIVTILLEILRVKKAIKLKIKALYLYRYIEYSIWIQGHGPVTQTSR